MKPTTATLALLLAGTTSADLPPETSLVLM